MARHRTTCPRHLSLSNPCTCKDARKYETLLKNLTEKYDSLVDLAQVNPTPHTRDVIYYEISQLIPLPIYMEDAGSKALLDKLDCYIQEQFPVQAALASMEAREQPIKIEKVVLEPLPKVVNKIPKFGLIGVVGASLPTYVRVAKQHGWDLVHINNMHDHYVRLLKGLDLVAVCDSIVRHKSTIDDCQKAGVRYVTLRKVSITSIVRVLKK